MSKVSITRPLPPPLPHASFSLSSPISQSISLFSMDPFSLSTVMRFRKRRECGMRKREDFVWQTYRKNTQTCHNKFLEFEFPRKILRENHDSHLFSPKKSIY